MARTRKPDPKLTALRESGTVNPHAQDIDDPVFAAGDFFDPRDLVQARYEMLRRVHTEGLAIAEVAARFGVSRPTFYKTQAQFERKGLVGLLPDKRGPHGPHKVTDEVMRFIEEARAGQARLDAHVLIEQIAERFGVSVHRRTVARALARWKKKQR
jgi:transposase